jgi:hypothetical protein
MTRFQILELISGQNRPLTCEEIAKLSGHPTGYSRSFYASVASRLRRLWRLGLLCRDSRPSRRLRGSVYVWTLSERGKERLLWARSQGKVSQ